MNINRNKNLAISFLTIALSFLLLTFSIHAASRGITIKAKTSSGTIKEIQLYSGYNALVVGVSDYDSWPDLPNAVKDAHDIAKAFKKMGFKVTTVTNPNSNELKKALNDITYKDGRDSDRALLFYYAGHGETEKLADGTKLGYIIPTDCPLLKDDPIGFVNKAISMKDIESYSLRIRSKHVLMLFDSCFSGSLFSLVRAVPEDITEKSTLPVRQYITAGTEDESVPDRSMFKRCLMIGLDGDADLTRDGYITGTELGLYLSDKVVQNTRRGQHPQYGKIRTPELARGDFIFHLASSGAVIEKPTPTFSKAYLSVESNVSGAKVLVDDSYIGTTNLSGIKISPGEHRVRVEKDGYEPYFRRVRFISGRNMSLTVVLDKKTAPKSSLNVYTNPIDAKVRILNIGPKFYQGIELKSGRYHVEVSAGEYKTKRLWVTLGSGEDKSIDVRLEKRTVDSSSSYSSYSSAKEIKRDRRFIAYDNGTVIDTKTGLMWASKDHGKRINWKTAKQYCENYRGGEYTDWRMPTIDELAGLYDKSESYQSELIFINVHLTRLIHLTDVSIWASETRGSKAAYFNFESGNRGWRGQSGAHFLDYESALPVRSSK